MARILVIDDEYDIRIALRKMLEYAGYEVIEASNGREGIQVFTQNAVDLIITDILMPEKDGVEILRELRADYPSVKIIAISGRGHEYLPIAREFGAFSTLFKPFQQSDVLKAVAEALAAQP